MAPDYLWGHLAEGAKNAFCPAHLVLSDVLTKVQESCGGELEQLVGERREKTGTCLENTGNEQKEC